MLVKFLWMNISHSCFIVKLMSKFYYLTTNSKPWPCRPGIRKKDYFSVTGVSDLGPNVGAWISKWQYSHVWQRD